MRTRVVIQSRLNSSRLPGKALLSLAGMPLIELVARRAARSGHEVIVATSVESYDDRISEHLERVGLPVYRGSLDDVLDRFEQSTRDLDPGDRVVRLTGDNPVADADLVDELIAAMEASEHDYARVDIEEVPEGLGAEAFTVDLLRAAAATATAPYDREHVTPWIRRQGELLFVPAANPGDPVAYRCTVDCLADYDRVSRLFAPKDDAIAVPWAELVADLKRKVDAAGPMVPEVSGREGQRFSRLLLGGSQLGGDYGLANRTGQPDAPTVRAMLATAVARGVSHVMTGRMDGRSEAVVRAGSNPALQQRIGVITQLAPMPKGSSPEVAALSVEASLERSFAELGGRRAGVVLFGSVSDALAGKAAAWHRLQEYQASGEVAEIGVVVDDPGDVPALDALDGVNMVLVRASIADRRFTRPATADRLAHLASQGALIAAKGVLMQGVLVTDGPLREDLPGNVDAVRAGVRDAAAELGRDPLDLCVSWVASLPWVDAVVVGAETEAQLEQLIRAASRPALNSVAMLRAADCVPHATPELLAAAS